MSSILLIDDEESLRWSYALILETAGHQVATAEDYDSALELLSSNSYDLIISDLLLPGHSGLEIVEWLTNQHIDVPVVIVTGQPEQETVCRGFELGVFEYLTKPVRKNDLLSIVNQVNTFTRL